MKAIQVYRTYYLNVLEKLPASLRAFLDDNISADKYYLVFVKGYPVAGFCTNRNGYMNGLFSTLKGTSNSLITLRLATAATDASDDVSVLELFCTGNKMRDKYENLGFSTAITHIWDDQMASTNWDYDKFGRPDVHTLRKQIK